jgi:hypothetical protein
MNLTRFKTGDRVSLAREHEHDRKIYGWVRDVSGKVIYVAIDDEVGGSWDIAPYIEGELRMERRPLA